jgi:hypothetical protein
MASGKVFHKIDVDDQATGLTETMSAIRYATKTVQELVLQIPGVTSALQQSLLAAKACCDIVLVVTLNNGVEKVMGYDVDYAEDTASDKNCQFSAFNFVSQTAGDDDYARFEGTATCTATGLAPIFTGTLPT